MSLVQELEAAGEILSPAVRAGIVALEARLQTAEAQVGTLTVKVQELERRLGLNSRNSSLPPSSDRPGVKRRQKKPSGRRPGAQPGHKSQQRSLLPPERVDHWVLHRPSTCQHCGHAFEPADAAAEDVGSPGIPERRQVIELPVVRAEVSEHQLFSCRCPVCGQTTKAAPPGVGPGTTFGPRIAAFAAALTLRCRASRRSVRAVLGDLLDVEPPAVGTLQQLLEEASAAAQPAYEEVRCALRASEAAGADETGWKKRGLRYWLWVAATAAFSFFRLSRRRSAEERKALFGEDYPGVVTSDRAGAYHGLARRQLCWAHLKRDFEAWSERGGRAGEVGRWAVAETERMFQLWARFRDSREGDFSRDELKRRMRPLQARFTRLLYHAVCSGDKKVEHTADQLLGLWDALWVFLDHEQVEPTNNEAERSLRTGVIWRKTSFGSKSEEGLRMVERLLTVAETAKKQGQDLMSYLTRAITARRLGHSAPALFATP